MFVKSVRFRNFGPFRKQRFEFNRGLVGISGPNGSGKSTLVNGIYAALTNDFGRFHGVKADNIHLQARKREPSFVEVDAEHNGVPFVITRKLRPNGSELTIDGGQPITNSDDITLELTQRLGVDKKLIDNYVFIKQGEMASFLSQTPQRRAEAFQRLCRTEYSVKIHDCVASVLKANAATELVDNSDWLVMRIGEEEQRITELEEGCSRLEKKKLNATSKKSAKEIVQRAIDHRKMKTLLDRMAGDLPAIEKKEQDANTNVEELIQAILDDEARLKNVLHQRKQGEQLESDWKLYNSHNKQVEQLESAISRDEKSAALKREVLVTAKEAHTEMLRVTKGEPVQTVLRTLESDRDKLSSAVSVREDVTELDLGTCPTCRQEIGEEFLRTCSEELEELRPKFKKAEKDLAWLRGVIVTLRNAKTVKQELDQLNARLEENRNELEELQKEAPERPTTSEEDAEALVTEVVDLEDAIAAMRASLNEARQELGTASANLANSMKTIAAKKQEVKKLTVSANVLAKAEKRLRETEEAEEKIAESRGSIRTLQEQIVGYREQLESLRSRKEKIGKMEEARRIMSLVQETFHWSNLPRRVSQANLERMEGEINADLGWFGDPFMVNAGDDLSLTIQKPGMEPHRAERCSGGQQGVLAISFRLTANRLFGTDLGLMVMDEPTEGLDADNLRMFQAALEELAAQVQGDRQLLLITHNPELVGACEQAIRLQAPETVAEL